MVRLKTRVNPIIGRDTIIRSSVIATIPSLMLFYWGYNPIMVFAFFAFSWILSFGRQYAYAPNAFKRIILDEKGLQCGKQYIKWEDVHTINIFQGYVRYINFSRILNKWEDYHFSEYSCGKMIGINTFVEEDFARKKDLDGIYIYADFKTCEILGKYCEKYSMMDDPKINIYGVHSHRKTDYFLGNPYIIGYLLILNLIFTSMAIIVFCGIYYPDSWKGVIIVVPIHIFLWLCFKDIYSDAFSIIKLNEDGITCNNVFVSWDNVHSVKYTEKKISIVFFKFKCGMIVEINSQYSDIYMGRHSCDCIYICKTKRFKRCFENYLNDKAFL